MATKNEAPILGANTAPVNTENWKAPYEDSWSKNYNTRMVNARKGIGTLGAALVSPVHSVAAGLESLAGFGGNVISAMGTPTAPGHSMDMVAGKTQGVAEQLGSTARNLSQPAAAATQFMAGVPVTGNPASTMTAADINNPPPAAVPVVTSPVAAPPAVVTQAAPAPPAPAVGAGSTITLGDTGKVIDASGSATGGFARNETQRLASVAQAGIDEAYAASPNSVENRSIKRMADQATQTRISELNQTIANVPSQYEKGFVGDAKMSNPSYRNAQEMIGVYADKSKAAQAELGTILGQQKLGQEGDKVAAESADKKYASDQLLAGHKLTAEANVEAHNLSASATMAKDANEAAVKAAAAEAKKTDAILTNGYGVAPTPEAIKSYNNHQTRLSSWDKETTKMLTAHTKANPSDGVKIKDALIAYHRNPGDPAALEAVKAAQDLLSGGGKGTVPDWFVKALAMPKFETAGLQTWKQP